MACVRLGRERRLAVAARALAGGRLVSEHDPTNRACPVAWPFVALYFVERSRGPLMLLAIAVVTSALSFSGGWAFWRPLSHNMFVLVLGMLVPTLGYRLV